jgi:hypothetical protein
MKSERLSLRPEASTSPESQHRHFWDIAAVALLGSVLGVAGSRIGRGFTPDNLTVGELIGLLAGIASSLAIVFAIRKTT